MQRVDSIIDFPFCTAVLQPHLLKFNPKSRAHFSWGPAFPPRLPDELALATSDLELQPANPITTTLAPHHTTHPSHTTANMLASRVAARSARAAAPRFQAVSSRGFAEAAKVDSKPPVALFGVDGTYASALVRNRWKPGKRQKIYGIQEWDS